MSTFAWSLPERLNIGVEVADRRPREDPAILVTDGRVLKDVVTYRRLATESNRMANLLSAHGVHPGDRVAIVLSQRVETALAHIAVYKLGAIAVPLSVQFGPEALDVRLQDADVHAVIADSESVAKIGTLGLDAPVLDVDESLTSRLMDASPAFNAAATTPDTPALLIYTSGTTGQPKGVLHGHRILAGHLPGFELSHDHLPQAGDRIWTPADWAWIGGLYDVLMPALFHGVPVVAYRDRKFDPERAFDLIAANEIRNVFMPATALRMMRAHEGAAPALRTVASGGETVGADTAAWCEERLGVRLNEFYGQTEANLLIGNSCAWPAKPGSMGRAYPGHDVRLIQGEIALRTAGDPVAMLRYWRNDEATAAKIRDGWLQTGDLAERDDDGYFHSIGRADDLISSGGYRIGPGEIEECLSRHDRVLLAAVIGTPDPVRGEVVKAFVVPVGSRDTATLAEELKTLVRRRLAPYEVPREIEFVDELPLTVTGKLRRSDLRRREAERRSPSDQGARV